MGQIQFIIVHLGRENKSKIASNGSVPPVRRLHTAGQEKSPMAYIGPFSKEEKFTQKRLNQ